MAMTLNIPDEVTTAIKWPRRIPPVNFPVIEMAARVSQTNIT